MSGYLLDVNVLIALIDPNHVHHDRAHGWFASEGQDDWLSCPTTQNGAVRIVSHPRYPNPQTSPATVIKSVRSLTVVGSHRFVPDDISLLDAEAVNASALLSSAQITDTYLLARAISADASLATFDTRLVTAGSARAGDNHVSHIA